MIRLTKTETIDFNKIRSQNLERIRKHDFVSGEFNFDALPLLEKTEIRPIQDIASRAVFLAIFKLISVFPEDLEWYADWLADNNFGAYLSNREKTSLNRGVITKQEEIDYSWYQESINCIMWILGFEDASLNSYDEIDCAKLMKHLPPETSLHEFQSKIKLRPAEELFRELDIYYLLHWLARRNKSISVSVIRERRKVLEWCLDKEIRDWDNVSLDT